MDNCMRSALWCAAYSTAMLAFAVVMISGGAIFAGCTFLFLSAFGFIPITMELLGV